MTMSFADVVPLPVVGGCVQEGSVGLQRSGGVASSGEELREGGEVLREGLFPESVSRSLAEQFGLSTLAVGLGSAALGEAVSCGFRELDRLLPSGGIRRGSLVEWLPAGVEAGLEQAGSRHADGQSARSRAALSHNQGGPGVGGKACDAGRQGSGVVTFAMAVAAQVVRAAAGAEGAGGATTVLVVDRSGWFYPPAVMRWFAGGRGPLARGQFVVVRPSRDDDEVWAIDQALRCAGVAAVVACPSAAVLCANVMRRWQLAARGSGAVGMLVRPWQSRRDPSWAEVRLVVTPLRRPVAGGSRMPHGRAASFPSAGLPGGAVVPQDTTRAAMPHRQLLAPPVAPRSEAVLRWWRIERLSSLLYGEGANCEVVMDLERGVEAAAVKQVLARQQARAEGQQSPQSCGVPGLLSPSVQQPQEVAGKVFLGSVLRKDGVACRAS